MQIYNYDSVSHQYIGASTAFESPLEPGVFLVPGSATETAPPAFDSATQQCFWTNGAWTVSPILSSPPENPTAAEIAAAAWSTYQTQAQTMLAKSDLTMLRCFENGTAAPSAWVTYRKALRAIVGASSGDPSVPLPATPPYPAD